MELLKYEIYKIFTRKIVFIGLIIFIPIYLIYTLGMNVSYLSSYREAYGYYRTYEGELDSSKADKINKGMAEVNDLYKRGVRLDSKHLAVKILYTDMTDVNNDRINLDNIKSKLENEVKKADTKIYEYRKALMELKNIEETQAITGLNYTEGWRAAINFYQDIGYWFVIIFSLLGISGVISQEYSDGMNTLIRSTKKGKRDIVIAKIGAAFLFTLAVITFVCILNLVTNAYFYGLYGFNANIRYIYDLFKYSAVNIKIWQFYLIMQFFIILGAFAVSLAYILISIFNKNSSIPFMIVLMGFFISDMISRKINVFFVRGLLPSEFLRLSNLYKGYSYVYNVFGLPVTYERLLLAVDILSILFLSWIIVKSFKKYGLKDYQ